MICFGASDVEVYFVFGMDPFKFPNRLRLPVTDRRIARKGLRRPPGVPELRP